MKTERNKKLSSVSFIIISILLHCLLVVIFYAYAIYKQNQIVVIEKPETTEITFLDINDVDLSKMKGNIVEQEDPKKKTKKAKDDAKYLSLQNQIVEKETRAAKHGEFQNAKSQKAAKQTSASQANQVVPTSSSSPEIKTYENGDMMVGEQQKVRKAKTVSDLRPNSMADMSESAHVSQSQTNDYLKDVVISAETNLNTKEYLYYSYFNRIKKKLRQHWEPMVHAKVRMLVMKGRQPASMGSKTTRCVITLDDRGLLTRVQVLTTSGLEDLDDAALEALKAAAPFPNPPKDLITDGLVRINWDFILES